MVETGKIWKRYGRHVVDMVDSTEMFTLVIVGIANKRIFLNVLYIITVHQL